MSRQARITLATALAITSAGVLGAGPEAARTFRETIDRLKKDPRVVWAVPLKAPSYGSGAAADIDGDGKFEIVFGTYFNDEHVYAVNAEDGSMLWKVKSQGGPVDTSILIEDVNGDGQLEVVYGDSAYGTLFCLNGKTGKTVWTFKGQSGTDSPPAAADIDGDGDIEVVYGTMKANNKAGFVNVLDGKTGKPVWSVEVPGHIQSEPALVDLNGDGTLEVLVNNWVGDNKLRALDGKDGATLWHFDTGDWIYHGVSVADFDKDQKPEIVVCDRKGTVWMLQGESGQKAWVARLEGETDGSVFGPTTLVDVGGNGAPEILVCGHKAHLLDAKGKLRWRNEYGVHSIARGAATADLDRDGVPDLVFGEQTNLRAVSGGTGKEAWSIDLRLVPGKFYEDIDHAPLVLDIDNDGNMEVFVVSGVGVSGDDQPNNYGCAFLLRTDAGPKAESVRATGNRRAWTTFRGSNRRLGRVLNAAERAKIKQNSQQNPAAKRN